VHRIDTTTKFTDLFGVGKHGFRDGNKALVIAATAFNAAWANSVQEELANTIEGYGGVLDAANNAQFFGVIKAAKQLNFVAITSSGNFATPANITTATVFEITLVGGGGGGGASSSNTVGSGGGAGGAVSFLVSGLLPNTNYAVVIGGAGAGGGVGGNGGAGGTTQITINGTVYSANGGAAGSGTSTAAISSTSGQGGVSASISTLPSAIYIDHLGHTGFGSTAIAIGCNGGYIPFGTAGLGGNDASQAGAAIGNGCGGGGGARTQAGANGSPGLLIAKWVA